MQIKRYKYKITNKLIFLRQQQTIVDCTKAKMAQNSNTNTLIFPCQQQTLVNCRKANI